MDTSEQPGMNHSSDSQRQTSHAAGGPATHETTDVGVRSILGMAGILTAVVIATLPVVGGIMGWLSMAADERDPPISPLAATDALPPAPRLEASPPAALREFLAEEGRLADGYDWVDRSAGQVRIPIHRAMELVAQRGLPELDDAGNSSEATEHESP